MRQKFLVKFIIVETKEIEAYDTDEAARDACRHVMKNISREMRVLSIERRAEQLTYLEGHRHGEQA